MDNEAARDHLREASSEFRAVRTPYDAAREKLRAAIVTATKAGVPQKEIVELTGYTRENIRKIARASGVEAQ